MKKSLVWVLCISIMFMGLCVKAQELSGPRKTATFAPNLLSYPVTDSTKKNIQRRIPKKTRTTILRFEDGQTALNDIQKELLLKIVERIANKQSYKINVVSASTEEKDAQSRAVAIESFLRSYERDFQYGVRYIRPENVVGSVNNTVKITEKN